MSKVPLVVKKEIKEGKASNEESWAQLNKDLGTDIKLDLDLEQFYADIQENTSYGSRPGEVSKWYINALVNGLKSFAAKDEMYKEALVEEVESVKGFKIVDDDGPWYCKLALEGKDLVILIKKTRLAANVDNITDNIEELF